MGFAQPGSATMLMAKPVGQTTGNLDVFFRHMVGNMRNGVLAIDRDGGTGAAERRSAPALPPGARRGRRPRLCRRAPRASRHRPRARRRLRAEGAAQPRRTAPQVHRHRDRLHAVAGPRRRRRDGRRGAVLQGPDARRADRGARAPARSARRGRRDGGGDGARDQEPARRHRSAGGTAPPQGARQRRRAGARQGHHQRSQDGQRDRAGGAGVRAAGRGCRSIARRCSTRSTPRW